MDLNTLIRTDLVLMCNQLGIELGDIKRKPHIINAILAANADDNKLIECWEKFKDNKRAAEQKRRSEKIAEQKRRQEAEQKRRAEAELALQKHREFEL